jgi:hypothetical protein
MLQPFLIPHLDEDDQEERIHFQQDGAPLITFEKCAITSAPVSQVGGLVEWLRWHGHLVLRILHTGFFSNGDSLEIECSYHFYLKISLNS